MAMVWLDELELGVVRQGWGVAMPRKSVGGNPLTVAGREYQRGVGTHAIAEFKIRLDGCASRFAFGFGIDSEVGAAGAARVEALVDRSSVYTSPKFRGGEPVATAAVDLAGARELVIIVHEVGGMDMAHVDLVDAAFEIAEGAVGRPAIEEIIHPDPRIATTDRNACGIHGPRVVGLTPWRDFLYRVPASGLGPLTYAARGLPDGLSIDPQTGIICGRAGRAGEFDALLEVTGHAGRAERPMRFRVGTGKLALTPPMGWNSWNCWGKNLDAAKVRDAARAMVDSGLADFGYQYINLDDGWQGARDPEGRIHGHSAFPDMKAVADDIHALGLRAGIYSSPGPKTCAGFEGSLGHEVADARRYAEWGYDYLKYDYCTYSEVCPEDTLAAHKKPYLIMGDALRQSGRDIVFAICTEGNFEPWNWATEAHAHLWRTTPDIVDSWGSVAGIAFNQEPLADRAKPGRWNDPDMLVVGTVGWGDSPRVTRLTRNEQVTHVTLWAMLAAPMLLGCDLTRLDEFTFNLLSNTEVIDLNQDALGVQGRLLLVRGFTEVWTRPLVGGLVAMAIFNRGPFDEEPIIEAEHIPMSSLGPIRDLWSREDLGPFGAARPFRLGPHQSLLFALGRAR